MNKRKITKTVTEPCQEPDSDGAKTPETPDFESPDPSFGSFRSFAEGVESENTIPPFPIECLPDVMANMVRETAASSLTPESMPAACALGVVAAALGAGIEMSSGGDRRCRGNLFVLCIAESGTGKDLAFRPLVQPLNNVEIEAHAVFWDETQPQLEAELQLAIADMERAKKDLKKKGGDDIDRQAAVEDMRDAQRRKNDLEKRIAAIPILVFTEPTREGLSETLSLQAGEASACMTPESRGVFAVLNGRYTGGKSTDEDLYCMAYSGTAHAERRKGRDPVTLRRPCLTVLWMIQPDKAHEVLADENLSSSGLLPRFLIFDSKAQAEQMPEILPRITDETRRSWHDLIEDLAKGYRLHGETFDVAGSPGVFDLMRDYENQTRGARNKRDGGELADVAPFAARWAEQAWRISLVLHAGKHSTEAHKHPLDLETAQQALTITRWFVDRQLALIQGERMRKLRKRANCLIELLQRDHHGTANIGELSKSGGWDLDEIEYLAKKLPKLLKREERKPAGGGIRRRDTDPEGVKFSQMHRRETPETPETPLGKLLRPPSNRTGPLPPQKTPRSWLEWVRIGSGFGEKALQQGTRRRAPRGLRSLSVV